MQRALGLQRFKQVFAQQAAQLLAGIGPAMAKGDAFAQSPQPAAVRNNGQQPSAGRQYAPAFPQEGPQLFRRFQRVQQHQPVDGGIRQWPIHLLHLGRHVGERAWPADNTLGRGHQGRHPLRLVQEGAEHWHWIADACNLHPAHVRPAGAHPLLQPPARH